MINQDGVKFGDHMDAQIGFNVEDSDSFSVGGVFKIECYDEDGNLRWFDEVHNFVTDEGIDNIMGVYFVGESQVDPWYVMLCGAGQKAITDTLASHAAWAEVIAYVGERKEYVDAGISIKTITNSASPGSFTINAPSTVVAGAGICSVVSGTVGTLFSVGDFDQRTTASGDVVNVTYTMYGSDS